MLWIILLLYSCIYTLRIILIIVYYGTREVKSWSVQSRCKMHGYMHVFWGSPLYYPRVSYLVYCRTQSKSF